MEDEEVENVSKFEDLTIKEEDIYYYKNCKKLTLHCSDKKVDYFVREEIDISGLLRSIIIDGDEPKPIVELYRFGDDTPDGTIEGFNPFNNIRKQS